MTATGVGGKINIELYWPLDRWLQMDLWIKVDDWEKRIICPRRVEVPTTNWFVNFDLHHYYGKNDNYASNDRCLLLGLTLRNEAGENISMNSCVLHPPDEAWQIGEWLIEETSCGYNLFLIGPVAETFISSLQVIFNPCCS